MTHWMIAAVGLACAVAAAMILLLRLPISVRRARRITFTPRALPPDDKLRTELAAIDAPRPLALEPLDATSILSRLPEPSPPRIDVSLLGATEDTTAATRELLERARRRLRR